MPYRNDLEAAHERIADLERSANMLQEKLNTATAANVSLAAGRRVAMQELIRVRALRAGRGLVRTLLLLAVLAVLTLVVAIVVQQATACASQPPPPLEVVDFCRVRFCDDGTCSGGPNCPETCLYGITRPSGDAELYGKVRDIKMATDAAKALGCQLESERR